MVLRVFASLLAVLLATGGAFAQATEPAAKPATAAKPAAAKPAEKPAAKPKPKPKPKTAAKPVVPRADAPATTGTAPDAKPEQSTAAQSIKDSYAALTFTERLSIQSDLIWTGDYNGMINGEFSDRLVAAVKAFQKRNKSKDTGVLNLQERAILAASAKPLQSEVGWRLAEDPVSGARVGLPGKLVPIATRGASGTRWSSQQGQFQIETFRIPNMRLEAVYERQRREPFDRRPSYNVLRPEFFVISGMQGLKKFYVRASAQDNEVRGITILYDQAEEGTMGPIVVAMSSAFAPFAQLGAMQEGVPSRRKVEYGTGLVVSSNGHVVTDKQTIDGCNVITIPGIGHAERLAEDKSSELALLRVYGARDLVPLGLLGAAPRGETVDIARHRRPAVAGWRRGDLQCRGEARRGRQSPPARHRAGAGLLRRRRHRCAWPASRHGGAQDAGRRRSRAGAAGRSHSAGARDQFSRSELRLAVVGPAGRGSQGLGGADHLREEIGFTYFQTSPAASRRRPPCLPSDPWSRTAHGIRGARTARLRRATSRTRG